MDTDLGIGFALAAGAGAGAGRMQVGRLGDDELLAGLGLLARDKHRNDAAMIEHLGEVERRRLFAREGWTSMFAYCVQVLGLSEGAAAKRIRAARLARRFPIVIDLVASGEVHLGGLSLLAAHLTDANHRVVLERARGKICREIEKLVAELAPRPDVPASIRRVPSASGGTQSSLAMSASIAAGGGAQSTRTPTSGSGSSDREQAGGGANRESPSAAAEVVRGAVDVSPGAEVVSGAGGRAGGGGRSDAGGRSGAGGPGRRTRTVEVLAPQRYLLKVTLGEEARGKLDHARDLLRQKVPDGDLAAVIELALEALVEKVEKRKFAKTASPRKRAAQPRKRQDAGDRGRGAGAGRPGGPATRLDPRGLPAEVRRAVVERDGQRCSYRSPSGKRCGARGWLEFHHLAPYAKGGPPTIDNCALFCRAHNQYAADLDYGRAFMERVRWHSSTAREIRPVWGPRSARVWRLSLAARRDGNADAYADGNGKGIRRRQRQRQRDTATATRYGNGNGNGDGDEMRRRGSERPVGGR